MDKDLPPPYSAEGNYPPPAGFTNQHTQQNPYGNYVQPPGYATHQFQPTTQNATVVVTTVQFGPAPQLITCPYCHNQITTKVDIEPATKTHLFALLLCFFGCVPCCILPYCIDSCQNQNHFCPQCNAFLGTYNNEIYGPYRRY